MIRLWKSTIEKVSGTVSIQQKTLEWRGSSRISVYMDVHRLTLFYHSRRTLLHTLLLRHESQSPTLDLHKRSAPRPTVLAREDTGVHIPARLVPMVRGVAIGVSTLSVWRSEHQCVEYGLCDGHCAGERCARLSCPVCDAVKNESWRTESE